MPPMTVGWSRVCHSSSTGVRARGGVGLDHPREQVEPRLVHGDKLAAGRHGHGFVAMGKEAGAIPARTTPDVTAPRCGDHLLFRV
jgi:hypothetical protein